jgi:hypothetical protein
MRLRPHIPVPRTSARELQKLPPPPSHGNPRKTQEKPTETQEKPAETHGKPAATRRQPAGARLDRPMFFTFGCWPERARIVVARTSPRLCAELCVSTTRNAGRLQEQKDNREITRSGLPPGVPMFIASLKPLRCGLATSAQLASATPSSGWPVKSDTDAEPKRAADGRKSGGVPSEPAPRGVNPALRTGARLVIISP